MTDLPPDPSRWHEATLVLAPDRDGHHGTLTYDGMTIYVRRWRKAATGVVRFECQHQSDAEMERLFGP